MSKQAKKQTKIYSSICLFKFVLWKSFDIERLRLANISGVAVEQSVFVNPTIRFCDKRKLRQKIDRNKKEIIINYPTHSNLTFNVVLRTSKHSSVCATPIHSVFSLSRDAVKRKISPIRLRSTLRFCQSLFKSVHTRRHNTQAHRPHKCTTNACIYAAAASTRQKCFVVWFDGLHVYDNDADECVYAETRYAVSCK